MPNRLQGKRVALLDIENAGGEWVKLVEEICEGRQDEQALQTAGSGG
jgi:hypothetical protein